MYLPTDEDSPEPHHNKKKNTKKWCRGKVGREHVTHITISNYSGMKACDYSGWKVIGKDNKTTPFKRYICWHQRSCKNCGKVLEWLLPQEQCPDYKEPDA